MTPDQFKSAAIKIFGRKKWAPQLAHALGVDRVTIYRLLKREQVAGPYEVAIVGMLQNKQARDKLEKEARRLLPREFKQRDRKRRSDYGKPRQPKPERKPDGTSQAT